MDRDLVWVTAVSPTPKEEKIPLPRTLWVLKDCYQNTSLIYQMLCSTWYMIGTFKVSYKY